MPHFVDNSPPGHCIFCRLIAREIPAAVVHEDDLGQVNPGHVLVATRRHADTLYDLTDAEAAAVMQTSRRIAVAAQKAFPSAGLTLLQANGAEGGQTVKHVHMHVVPRHADDGIALSWPRKEPGGAELGEYAERLKSALAETAG